MKRFRCLAYGLAMAIVVIFSMLPAAQATQNLDFWPIDTTGANGDNASGQLTIYYEIVDQGGEFQTYQDYLAFPAGCPLGRPGLSCLPGDGYPPDVLGQPTVKMVFMLKLYEKKTKTWHIITGEDSAGPYEGAYCITANLLDGVQQAALMNFLNTAVPVRLTGGTYTTVFLKDVDDDYENIITPPLGPPYCVMADIVIVAQ